MAAIPILGNEKIIIFPVDSVFISLKLLTLLELDFSSLNYNASRLI